MKLIHSAFLVSFLAALSSTYATQVSFNGGSGLKVFKADGTTVLPAQAGTAAGPTLYWVGTFTSPGGGGVSFNPGISIAANVTAIQSAWGWHQFTLDQSTGLPDSGSSSTDAINGLNRLSGTFTDPVRGANNADFFTTSSIIYVWILNNISGATVNAPSDADEMGIFTANLGSPSPAWTFPDASATPPGNTKALNVASGTMSAIGGAGSVGTGLQLASAPEPSTLVSLIGAGGLVGMLRRRRASK